jgi:predicted nucleic acid-binding protein
MYALDTNILVYAHNTASPWHPQAKNFVEKVMNTRNSDGEFTICLPEQVIMEFLNVITWHRLESPLSLPDALQIVQEYLDTGITILYQRTTHLDTLISLLNSVTTRKKIFDVALVATLKEHGISGIYTVNSKDFEEFTFLFNGQNILFNL